MNISGYSKCGWFAALVALAAAGTTAGEPNAVRNAHLESGKIATDYRNVALNPADTTNREPVTFPHATSNSEYNQREFAARCAIDGSRRNDDVHNCGSWGPQRETNIWWRLDFGRPVEIDKLTLFLRAAWMPTNAPHDSYWKEALVAFSDGSVEKLELKQVAAGQEFPIALRTVNWLVLKNLKPAEDKWCALCEFEAWGRDAPGFAYVGSTNFAAQLRQDARVAGAMSAMLGFQRSSWEQGVAGQALVEAGEEDAAIALARASLVHVNASGVVAANGGSTTDPLMLGDCLWWAARQTGDPALVKAADDMLQFALKGAPRAADGTPYHQAGSREMWSDGSFTTPPFLAAAGQFDAAIDQLLGVRSRLWDPDKKLMHHRWSEPRQALVDSKFWGGGNGWTAAAFARVIRSLPPDRTADRVRLATMLRELLDGCLAHQRSDGLFYDQVDNPESYVETNLASMLAYAIYESVRGGWLPEEYLVPADRMRAAVRAKVDRLGFVQGVAGAPHFDRPGISTEGQAFFILMEAAARKAGR
ncbi:MAG TPA: glycoside hydrolase family 88 protein [Candidatus Acidoferrum sp.]|nr:glycoside hydrolase family 88 protein [Candidatus Acidoferrum sp.]